MRENALPLHLVRIFPIALTIMARKKASNSCSFFFFFHSSFLFWQMQILIYFLACLSDCWISGYGIFDIALSNYHQISTIILFVVCHFAWHLWEDIYLVAVVLVIIGYQEHFSTHSHTKASNLRSIISSISTPSSRRLSFSSNLPSSIPSSISPLPSSIQNIQEGLTVDLLLQLLPSASPHTNNLQSTHIDYHHNEFNLPEKACSQYKLTGICSTLLPSSTIAEIYIDS